MKDQKIAFVLAMHHSDKIRPNGLSVIHRFLDSLRKSCEFDYTVFLFDNESTEKIDLSKYSDMDIKYTYIEDQSIGALTGTWNAGCKRAYEENYDQIYISNDDLIFNKSINELISIVSTHEHKDIGIFGPLCQPDGVLGGPQGSSSSGHNIREITGTGEVDENPTSGALLNGFFFGFTNKFYDTFKLDDGYVFNKDEKYKWSANECEFQLRLWKEGVKSFVVEKCWIYHEKIRSWKYQYGERHSFGDMMKKSLDKLSDYQVNWKQLME